MQDIDFDELDRAVSSVMTNPSDDTTPVVTPEPNIETPAQPAPTSPAVRRSSGRFMDVVHPSSDMRGTQQPSRPKAPESAPSVAPAPQPAEEATEKSGDAFSWPDPIDLAAAKMPDQPEPVVEAPSVTEEPTTDEPESPLESPFLTDTKVEKRPLGAFSETSAPLDLSAALDEISNETSEAVENTEVAESTSPSAPLAVHEVDDNALELSEEALIGAAVSSDTSSAESTPEPSAPVKTPEETSAADLEPTVPLGAASIPQQYAEQPNSNNQPSGAIYDTEAYHQPLNHPHKKGNGWLVVLWIVGLIVLGGGLGAALYFFVLPQL